MLEKGVGLLEKIFHLKREATTEDFNEIEEVCCQNAEAQNAMWRYPSNGLRVDHELSTE